MGHAIDLVMKPTQRSSELKRVPTTDHFDQMDGFSESIQRHAFEIFQVRGGANGSDLDDWLRIASIVAQADVATRLKDPQNVSEVVEVISRPRAAAA